MYADQAGAAASVDCHAGSMNVKEVGYPVGHDGNPIARCAICSQVLGISHRDLLVVCVISVNPFRYTSIVRGIVDGLTFDKGANIDGGIAASQLLFWNTG